MVLSNILFIVVGILLLLAIILLIVVKVNDKIREKKSKVDKTFKEEKNEK